MAFPTLADVTNSSGTNDATNGAPITMPATVNAGDLLVIVCACDSGNLSQSFSAPTGWTLVDTHHEGADAGGNLVGVAAKDADGTEDGTTVDFPNTENSENIVAFTFRFSAWHGTTLPEGVLEIGPNPSALNPAGWGTEDTYWISIYSQSDNFGTITSPTSYSAATTLEGGSGSSFAHLAYATRENAVASEDPAAWSDDAATINNDIVGLIAVRPASTSGFGPLAGQGGLAGSGGLAGQTGILARSMEKLGNLWVVPDQIVPAPGV